MNTALYINPAFNSTLEVNLEDNSVTFNGSFEVLVAVVMPFPSLL